MKRNLLILMALFYAPVIHAQAFGYGWTKLNGTSILGGTEPPTTATICAPDNFPNNLNASYTSYQAGTSRFAGDCAAIYNDSNTAIVDTSRNRMIFMGGGHNVSYENDLFGFEASQLGTGNPVLVRYTNPANFNNPYQLAAPTYALTGPPFVTGDNYETEAACFPPLSGTTYVSGCTPTHVTPAARHTYGNMVYIPTIDSMLLLGGAVITNGGVTNVTWLLPLSSINYNCAQAPAGTFATVTITPSPVSCDPLWTQANPTITGQASSLVSEEVNQIQFDPQTGLVWAFLWGSTLQIANYNPLTNTWFVNNNGSVGGSTGYHNFSVFDPIHEYLISMGADGIYYIPVANNALSTTLNVVRPTTTGCTGIGFAGVGVDPGSGGTSGGAGSSNFSQYPGLVWDPIDRRVVIWANGYTQGGVSSPGTIFLLDPATWTCTTETWANPPPAYVGASYSGTYGVFGHLAYLPKSDIFAYCNNSGGTGTSPQDCYVLKRPHVGNIKVKH